MVFTEELRLVDIEDRACGTVSERRRHDREKQGLIPEEIPHQKRGDHKEYCAE